MSEDLEKKVLQETSTTGALIGAGTGALAGALLAGVYTAASGGDSEQIKRNAGIAAGAGGLAGASIGYSKGREKGARIVTTAMTRDRAEELVKGAKAHNQALASYNSDLKSKLASAHNISDPKEKKIAYKALAKQTDTMIKTTNDRIEKRKEALQGDKWAPDASSQKSQYRSLTDKMVIERDALASQLAQVSKLEQSVVY